LKMDYEAYEISESCEIRIGSSVGRLSA
jgi:hypothetical protein